MEKPTANGDLKDSLVLCMSGEGHEVRGRLVKLTRHAVAFEVFSHGGDLRLSEVLANFRIIFHEHTIYSGHATVNNLMTMRQAIVCTATLDEAERFVAVLEIPPVESALTAVRVSIVADGKKNKK